MKQCPQCNQQFTDAWISFCPNDGSVLREGQVEIPPPPLPQYKPNVPISEQATMWLPRQPQSGQGWVAPDERAPMFPVFQPPPPPAYVRSPSQGLALASMITALVGIVIGIFCLGPIPGIVAMVLGIVALSQIKKAPDRYAGKPFALVGVIVGSLTLLFYAAIFLYFILASIFFN